jgi:tetratricopeptide (TPR) repeat protein
MGAIGRQAEALPLFQRAYESNLKTLGKHHQWTWEAQLGMARCYEQLGRLGDSIALNRSINAEHKIHLGPHHFATLTSMNNLALVLGKAKQLEEAESLFRELVEIEMEIEMENKQRSNEGPKLALPLSNLADVLFDKGDFGEAEQLRRRSLGIHEKNNNTTEAAIHRSLLARVLFEQGKVKEAEREALRGNEVGIIHHTKKE